MSEVETCDMKCQAPFDFAWCEVHDTTFPFGESCKFNGRQVWEVYAEEADEQRGLKVRAELERDALADTIRRIEALCDEADQAAVDTANPEHGTVPTPTLRRAIDTSTGTDHEQEDP